MVNKEELSRRMAPLIKRAIMDSGRNQAEIAEELEVSTAAVSKWVSTGKIDLHHLYGLALATGKPPEYFFPGFEGNSYVAGGSMEDMLRSRADDTEFLESLLLAVLKAKQRAAKKS